MPPFERAPMQRRWRLVIAALVFAFAALYRFNALGGSLGGFDDDHFVHLAYAMQMQSGEQPLRDFASLGLSGARPSLTYELSAVTQTWLGRNWRSEALLTVGAIAFAASLTWLAAVRVAPPVFALAATLLSVFVAPKLYAYPKVLVLSAAAWLIGRYAWAPSAAGVVAMSVLTAIAFLFRHDFAVYVGTGILVVVLLAPREWWTAGRHAAGYLALTLLLVTPSLLIIERDEGLLTYLRDSAAAARFESSRTNLKWPAFSVDGSADGGVLATIAAETNAVAWLYYLHLAVPAVLLVALASRRLRGGVMSREMVTVAATAAIGIVTSWLLLRGNVGARFGDVGPVAAVLVAFTGALLIRPWPGGRVVRVVQWPITVAVIAATVVSVWVIGSVRRELDTTGWSDSSEKVVRQMSRVWRELGALPVSLQSGPAEGLNMIAAQYLNRCTAEHDRIVVFSYQPELLGVADRRFGAGRASFIPELLSDARHEQQALVWWRRQRVPLVLSEGDDESDGYASEFPLLDAHLRSHYVPAGNLMLEGGVTLHVFRASTASPASVDAATGLPCFQ
jgi:hypothetical protein